MFRLRSLGIAVLSAAAALAVSPGNAQEGGDLQAQILYAFHAEDTNELANLVQTLSTQVKSGGADAALRYHLAHAEYRFGLLAGERRAHEASAAFGDCVDELKYVLQQDVKSAEALALQSACYANLAKHRHLEAVLLRSRASERLDTAFAVAPRNPRVLYLTAMDGLARSKPGSQENQRAFEQLQLAARLFDQSSATRIDAPGWGHAEAYLALGTELKARGDLLGARNWMEKSLIAAPDFKAAQRQLAGLVRR
jgi:tetratricopeptide (TPR) repeat protein